MTNTASPSSDNETEIDFDHLNQFVQEDVDLTKEVFGLFKNQVDMWSRMLTPEADDETWSSVTHTLKGTAKAIGAINLAQRCERAEILVGEERSAGPRSVAVQDIEFHISRAIAEIQRWEYRQKLNEMRS